MNARVLRLTLKQIVVITLFAVFFAIMISENVRVYDFDKVPLDETKHSKFNISPLYYGLGTLISFSIFLPYFLYTNSKNNHPQEQEEKEMLSKKRKRSR